jgi:cytochrome c2
LAFRLAVVIPVLLLAGCLRAPASTESAAGCAACHPPHRVGQGACVDCHRGDPSARRVELAHVRLLTGRAAEHTLPSGPAVAEGRRLVDHLACRRCHTIAGKGNRLAAVLDDVAGMREQAALLSSLTRPVEAMPDFRLDEEQAEAIAAFLLHSAAFGRPEEAYRVHFVRATEGARGGFEEHCGGCHRRLGPGGPAGRGRVGPDLSGLFTAFYPHTAEGETAWTPAALDDWLTNPRAVRAHTTMPPVRLDDTARGRVVADLLGGATLSSENSRRNP